MDENTILRYLTHFLGPPTPAPAVAPPMLQQQQQQQQQPPPAAAAATAAAPVESMISRIGGETRAHRKRRFVREHALADRPHTSLWLAKTYVIPAGMYGSQVWGTVFLQAGREFSSSMSTLHLHFPKGTLAL